ncbi:hypothetical protein [Roseiterribacter gracilis]|uniref:Uncharacterized protein n=1 Tax=Roseiterribacter gracilis TaxID=2812848 RepID=A0A8S8X7J9_9PROT|nr:hypothetical protein TMPK1_06510 [Rhodospirillales bacterium TMPK1]
MSEMPFSENIDPSPTVIWFPSLVQSHADIDASSKEPRRSKPRRVHATRNDRSRRAEDERARLIRLIG